MERLPTPAIDWFTLTPILILLGGALLLLVAGSLTPRWPRGLYALVAASSAGAAGVMGLFLWHNVTTPMDLTGVTTQEQFDALPVTGPRLLVSGAIRFDAFAVWVGIAICVAILLTVLVTDDYLQREDMVDTSPEIFSLYLMAGIGGIVMGSANDLVVLFLGLEVLSIAMYVLAASHRRRIQSQESGLKYFVLGGFSSAFFLYGVALIYGASGTTNISQIVESFNGSVAANRNDALALAGVALLLVGLAFKAAAVPFHFWAPDVYQGAPTPVTAFLASVGKIAAFAAMLRVLIYALPHWRNDYQPVVWVIAAVTLIVGSVMAVVQTNVKRMLAFSSISHAGFLLVGVEAASHKAGETDLGLGVSSTLLYLMIYSVLVIGTFSIVTVVGRTGDNDTDLAGFRGLSQSKPVLAFAMTVLLLAQAGMPLTSGFIAKVGVIRAAVDEQSWVLAVLAMLSAVIAAFLYLRIMISMWIAEPVAGDQDREAVRVPLATAVTITISVAFTLFIGFLPGWLIDAAASITR